MPHDLIQGQGNGGPKVVKMADFKVCLLHLGWYACKQKTNDECWYSRTISKFVQTDFRNLFSFGITWP